MSVYLPVISSASDAKYLRQQTEGVLTGDDGSALKNRLRSLDRSVKRAGMWATFGAEVEFQFSINPEQLETAEKHGISDEDDLLDARHSLYWAVVEGANPHQIASHLVYKGDVVDPSDTGICALESAYSQVTSPDGQDDSIIEVQTAPGSALKAIDRYWRVISSIGKTAEARGLMAVINSTHVSTALLALDPAYNKWNFLSNNDTYARTYIAGVQDNLVTLQPFQLDAGVEEGQVILEAFPNSKSCSLAVYPERLEIRHPVVGVADPRIDALAVLNAVRSTRSGLVSGAAIRATRPTALIGDVYENGFHKFGGVSIVMQAIAGLDQESNNIVVPSDISASAHVADDQEEIDSFIREASAGVEGFEESSAFDGTGTVNQILRGVKVLDARFSIPFESRFHVPLQRILGRLGFKITDVSHRVDPTLIFDSPDLHRERRRHIKKSSRIRSMFGNAMSSVVGADESVSRRQELIDSQMVVLDTDIAE